MTSGEYAPAGGGPEELGSHSIIIAFGEHQCDIGRGSFMLLPQFRENSDGVPKAPPHSTTGRIRWHKHC